MRYHSNQMMFSRRNNKVTYLLSLPKIEDEIIGLSIKLILLSDDTPEHHIH